MTVSLVTGAAGFIGSHLAEKLLSQGHGVIGVDAFTEYYPRIYKENNLAFLKVNPNFRFIEGNLLELDLGILLQGVDYLFHQAAQAGVRGSWGESFEIYTRYNIQATQKLLEAAKGTSLKKFIYASSSSVYGDLKQLPMKENSPLQPLSPYGVSKLAAEHLCYLYWQNYGVPAIGLRYFTVYGPRQRPDMAFHKFIRAILGDRELNLYGDGEQTRDFTYIGDIIDANLRAMTCNICGQSFNIGGGSPASLNQVLALLEGLLEKKPKVNRHSSQKGDVFHTLADITLAREVLGYQPGFTLDQGLAEEIKWIKKIKGRGL